MKKAVVVVGHPTDMATCLKDARKKSNFLIKYIFSFNLTYDKLLQLKTP